MNGLRIIVSFISTLIHLVRPGGVRAIAAENVALRQQLIVLRRHRKRAPKLTRWDRILFGVLAACIRPNRLGKIAILLKPATLLKFHKALVQRKYRILFTPKTYKKPGPKGPSQAVIDAIVEMKRRNPRFGYRRIAMQMSHAFGVDMDKDVVRRVLIKHHKPTSGGEGPSWLTFIGHMKDSFWSLDLFRCESIHLKTHWVMLVMDQFTRRLIGFATGRGDLDGIAVCCLFNKIISRKILPKYVSSDNDPLFRFHRWQANVRILEIEEIKTVPYTPTSHPFIERLIGAVRREFIDQTLFWNAEDLQRKLDTFQDYYNAHRCHRSLDSKTPTQQADNHLSNVIPLDNYRWQSHCRELFKLPIAA